MLVLLSATTFRAKAEFLSAKFDSGMVKRAMSCFKTSCVHIFVAQVARHYRDRSRKNKITISVSSFPDLGDLPICNKYERDGIITLINFETTQSNLNP